MSWDEFAACAQEDGVILAEAGADAIKEIADWWEDLSWPVKAMLTKAAEWGGEYLLAALTAAGLAASEVIAAAAAGASLGAIMAVIADCYDKL
jgi:hypothetical protein